MDFIVATEHDLTQSEQEALRARHGNLYDLPVAWAQHLEGSYAPKDALRSTDPGRRRFFFLDNGARELVWDDHCNTAVVRWSLRERGIALAGPAPNEIVDPVDPDVLRAEARLTMREFAAWADQTRVANRWTQSYVVLSLCRMLNTIDTGKVVSKREAGEWALEAGDPMWQSLIQAALDDRPDPWVRVTQPSSAEAVAETMAFVEAALRLL